MKNGECKGFEYYRLAALISQLQKDVWTEKAV
jgi:hypothetical protein